MFPEKCGTISFSKRLQRCIAWTVRFRRMVWSDANKFGKERTTNEHIVKWCLCTLLKKICLYLSSNRVHRLLPLPTVILNSSDATHPTLFALANRVIAKHRKIRKRPGARDSSDVSCWARASTSPCDVSRRGWRENCPPFQGPAMFPLLLGFWFSISVVKTRVLGSGTSLFDSH